ncbi:hypothetical protein GCM10010916_43450 [Paenibacillus abyssi]|uniref:Uncharacterized protein n=1 Tax=Paenibacillus abyssi TaxID=1340531 RepID=A0A917LGX6_9BACL|nr:hypothetical protein GCM10010916_43450 [Paenibacillus abyssi]
MAPFQIKESDILSMTPMPGNHKIMLKKEQQEENESKANVEWGCLSYFDNFLLESQYLV